MATLLVHRSASRPPLPVAGTIIAGRYEVTCPIGHGGNGAVFSARHLGTGQDVALKILLPPHDADETLSVKRFFLEARVTSGLKHPNTVRVFDFGQDDSGLVFLALELLSGRTLKKAIKERKNQGRAFTQAEAIDIATSIAKSLAEAHDAGLVHRDLKPENVFLHEVAKEECVVKVLDFGIAKLGAEHPTLSTPETAPGTPAYMSPEQALSGQVDARSDVYALGVILYQLVSSELPFSANSDPELLYQHAYRAPPDVRLAAKTTVSEAFARVIERALAKSPDDRFASAAEMREALAACNSSAVPGTTEVVPAVAPASRRWMVIALGMVVIAGVFGAGTFFAATKPEPAPVVVVAPPPPPVEPAPPVETESATVAPVEAPVPAPARVVVEQKKPVKKKKRKDILHRRIEDLVPGKE